MIRHLVVPLTFAVVALHASQALTQGTFPASSPLGGASDACRKEYAPLREEAEARGKLIKAAGERHAPPEEACRLFASFAQSEIKLIKYVEANSARCGFSLQISDQLKAGHKNTEAMEKKVCAVAQQARGRGPAGPVGDFDHIGAPPFAR